MKVTGILWISNSILTVTVIACIMLLSYVIYKCKMQIAIRNIGEYRLKNLFIGSTGVWILISMSNHTSIYQTQIYRESTFKRPLEQKHEPNSSRVVPIVQSILLSALFKPVHFPTWSIQILDIYFSTFIVKHFSCIGVNNCLYSLDSEILLPTLLD